MDPYPYRRHLRSSADLITTYEETRAGFVALALEKNRRATPFVEEARALQNVALHTTSPWELVQIEGIEAGLLTAAGLSDKALTHLLPRDREEAVSNLIRNFLEPAGEKYVEELVFRFLLTRGDALGGSMRNIGGALAQGKLTRAILSSLTIGGTVYRWQHSKTRKWVEMSADDSDIEHALGGLSWESGSRARTLIYNLQVPIVRKNVDLCLFSGDPESVRASKYSLPELYLALGELKGGIDPAGADEHWKTARTALERIRKAFGGEGHTPVTFFVGAAIEKGMAEEIWQELQESHLANAANLNRQEQLTSIARWLCML